ncbi:hypothetical protein CERSUDRAFT_114565 [Gelatoporia subvermispora B]|uniref:WW domain-containing protein n=1 Tax=Ceriporiopsis subvermispora (strain B) TaxID=914234 RepID=M2R095_CERS8|nr:hypothetical protein CERSUDRAFT_114565 [Gelatoporia subvermispora B]
MVQIPAGWIIQYHLENGERFYIDHNQRPPRLIWPEEHSRLDNYYAQQLAVPSTASNPRYLSRSANSLQAVPPTYDYGPTSTIDTRQHHYTAQQHGQPGVSTHAPFPAHPLNTTKFTANSSATQHAAPIRPAQPTPWVGIQVSNYQNGYGGLASSSNAPSLVSSAGSSYQNAWSAYSQRTSQVEYNERSATSLPRNPSVRPSEYIGGAMAHSSERGEYDVGDGMPSTATYPARMRD